MKKKNYSNKNRILSMMMAIVLTAAFMTGCGVGSSKKKANNRLEVGSISDNSVVIKVGDEAIRYREVRTYCYFLKCQYEGSFGKKLWKYPLENGSTIGEEAKQEIVNMVTQLKIISAAAKDQNVVLTPDEEDEALQQARTLMDNASQKDKESYFLNLQEVSRIYEENILANKMFYVATDDVPTNISDQEARQITVQYLQVMTSGIDRNGTEIQMNKETKSRAMDKAKRLRKEAKEVEDFLSYAQNNTDADTAELTIGRESQQLEQTVTEAAFQLKKDQLSEVITGEQGYYIVYCSKDNDEDATYQRKEDIIEERQTQMFMEKYSSWMKGKTVNISDNFWEEFSIY